VTSYIAVGATKALLWPRDRSPKGRD
jgi:hypothetical protein